MIPQTDGSILQYLRLTAKPDPQFEARLALAVHRQSTAPGFIASMEGAVMAAAQTWVALVIWADEASAHASTESWFNSDYHADFKAQVVSVDENRIMRAPPGVFEAIHGSRYARFLWLEQFRVPADSDWEPYLARRMTDFYARPGFNEAFPFLSTSAALSRGIVSTWDDALQVRQAAEEIHAREQLIDQELSSDTFVRISSSNSAAV